MADGLWSDRSGILVNDPSFKAIKLRSLIWLDTVDEEDSKPFSVPGNCRCPGRWNPPSPSTCYPTRLRLSQWLSGLAGKLVEQRRQVAQEGCAVPSQSQSSEVLQQCSVVSSGDWASASVGNSVSKVSDPSTSRCVSTLEWHDASLQSFVFVIPEFLL